MSKRVHTIGIAGPSASGKTAIANALAQALGSGTAALSCDGYYRDLSHLRCAERAKANFDHPDAIDHKLLAAHLGKLRSGEAVEDAPKYSFKTHTRLAETVRLEPKPIIIVEGLHVLHWPHVRGLLDFRVYVDASHQVCLARRVARDLRERGRSEENCREQYERTVRPMAEQYVIPSKDHADLVVDGTGPTGDSVQSVLRVLGEA